MSLKSVLLISLVLSVAAADFLIGCKDNGSEAPPPVSYYETQIQSIFTVKCVNAGCHPGGGAPISLPLQSGSSYNALVNVAAINGSCPGTVLRVKPGSADSSVLYQRIKGVCSLNQMPKGSGPLAVAEQDTIKNWINRGASRN